MIAKMQAGDNIDDNWADDKETILSSSFAVQYCGNYFSFCSIRKTTEGSLPSFCNAALGKVLTS